MARELPARFGITAHATRRNATKQMIVGVTAAALGALTIPAVGVLGGVLACLGVFLVVIGATTRAGGPAVQVINKSTNLASAGRLAEASELLDHAEATIRRPSYLRVVDLNRAIIAMRRGALPEALARADAAIARPMSAMTREQDRIHAASARALRALLRASTGDPEGARADIDEVRRSPDATPEALARAELAAGVLLERAGERAALREHLGRERRLLLEHTHPRERAIVRAWQRMLEVKATSVYREAAKEPQGEEPALADWIARIAPGAAAYVRRPAPAPEGDASAGPRPARAQAGVDPAARAAAEARARAPSARLGRQTVLLWVALVVLFGATWSFLSLGRPASGAPAASLPPSTSLLPALSAFSVLLGVGVAGLVASMIARGRRHTRRLIAAMGALARGDEARAAQELEELSRCRTVLIAAQAHLALAGLDERRADFPAALRRCEQALARLGNDTLRAYASDLLLPAILTERAYLFAVTGRPADAEAELALLAERYPSYAYLDAARLRVGMALAAARGDVAGVAALAERAADLPLSRRDELLADLARAAVRPHAAGAGEVARLKAELRVDAEPRRFLEAVAPAVLAAFSRAEHEAAEAETDAAAEAEAEAARATEAPTHLTAESAHA